MSNFPDREPGRPGPDHLDQSYDDHEAFDPSTAQGRARLVRVLAGRVKRLRTHHAPDTPPSEQDIHRARDMLTYLERLGYVLSYDPSKDVSR